MASALAELRAAYESREEAAHRWRARGGKVVGVVCDSVPRELIAAAGMLPFRLAPRPGLGRALVTEHIDALPDPFLFRPRMGSITALLEGLLSGSFEEVDYLVIPRTRTAVAALYTQLTLARRAAPELPVPELFYLDRAYPTSEPATKYNSAAIADLTAKLEEWAGVEITDAAIEHASDIAQHQHRLLDRIVRARRETPARIAGTDALRVFATANWMPAAAHVDLVERLLGELDSDILRPRVMISGSPQGDLRLYGSLEAVGLAVVAEDHCWGERIVERWSTGDIRRSSIIDRYCSGPSCCMDASLDDAVARCVRIARAAGVDAVVFVVTEGDDLDLWQVPAKRDALHAVGIATVRVEQIDYEANESEWSALAQHVAAEVHA